MKKGQRDRVRIVFSDLWELGEGNEKDETNKDIVVIGSYRRK